MVRKENHEGEGLLHSGRGLSDIAQSAPLDNVLLSNMRSVLNLLLEATPAISIQHVEPRHIKRVMALPASPHSRLSYYRQLRVFFQWCLRAGFLSEDPTGRVARPRPPKKTPSFFSALCWNSVGLALSR